MSYSIVTTCMLISVLVLADFPNAASVDFEGVPKVVKLYDEPTPISELPGHGSYCPNDGIVNAFQEMEFHGDDILAGSRGTTDILTNNESGEDFIVTDTDSYIVDPPQGGSIGCEQQAEQLAEGDADSLCQNYISVIQPIRNSKVIVCGTNALFPQCNNCTLESSNITCDEALAYFTDDSGFVAHGPSEHAAWLYLHSVEGFGDVVFAGGNEKIGQESIITRTTVNEDGILDLNAAIKTDKDDPNWLNNAEFVGDPIPYGDHVYYFFRETATEYINAGKIVYSRVGRVCKNDKGGGSGELLDSKFTTFQKARLNCSIQGEFPFYFNELQDIYQLGNEAQGVIIYASFSTPQAEATGSAVCVFRMDEINELFNEGKFKGQKTPQSLWLPADNNDLPTPPSPRPGSCNTEQPTTSYGFIKSFPLMNSLVPNTRSYSTKQDYDHLSNSALVVIQGTRIEKLVVAGNVTDASGNKHDIFFLASGDGVIFKAYLESDDLFVIIEAYDVEERVLTMKLNNKTALYVSTPECVHRLIRSPAERCMGYNKCYKCIQTQDPYCSWNMQDNSCQYPPTSSESKQCLRENENQEPYQCGDICADWPGPKVAFCSDNQKYVVNKPLSINLYFVITAPPHSNLDYDFTCTCDNGAGCTDLFRATPSFARNTNRSSVEWISVVFTADVWDKQCNATVELIATANGQNVIKTRRIEIDDTSLEIKEKYDFTAKDISMYDEQFASYQYQISKYQERTSAYCFPDGNPCNP